MFALGLTALGLGIVSVWASATGVKVLTLAQSIFDPRANNQG